MIAESTNKQIICEHCGDVCNSETQNKDTLSFCCQGCETVYAILQESDLGAYYHYTANPGISQKETQSSDFEYLTNRDIVSSLISFSEGGISKVTLQLPQIHCSSCLWLLEHISALDNGIVKSVVNFHKRSATITFQESDTTLKKIVQLLTKIGYEPRIKYNQIDDKKSRVKADHQLIYKLGLAGFSFGNIMLLSFPEYLGFDKASYLFYIGYINIILAIPVLLYSGFDYLKSAYKGLLINDFNIDLPIAIGMLALFGRSIYDILGHHGEGYLDSFAGFIFFLLIGRWFQKTTYQSLDFDRNYKSYFPISATVQNGNKWISKSLNLLAPKDILRIRNQELIPTDGVILKGKARIDYSFVTGESDLISKQIGEIVFAGGKHQGESIQIEITKSVDESYLTQLWNEDTFKKNDTSKSSKLVSIISKYFTISIILLATFTMLFWLNIDRSIAINSFTSVLIVACPCALALAIPFTYGNILRLLSQRGLYLKNIDTIEHIQDIDHIIFDKTGTLTDSKKIEIEYSGKALDINERTYIKSSCSHSSHPLSKAIVKFLEIDELIDVDYYHDEIGAGLEAKINNKHIKIGSSAYIFGTNRLNKEQGVFIEINGVYIGCFTFKHAFRNNILTIINGLQKDYHISLLSGDTDQDMSRISKLIGDSSSVHFNQSPKDKLDKIKYYQQQGESVMMIGDGLNDAGALKQADVGIVISDEENNFSPACDGILEASKFEQLYNLLHNIKKARYIIYGAFLMALLYNSIGLYFAMTGALRPVIAAILMPLSSISVILYGVVLSWILFKRNNKQVE